MSKKRKNSNYQTEEKKNESLRLYEKAKRTRLAMIIGAGVCLVAGVCFVLLALLGGN